MEGHVEPQELAEHPAPEVQQHLLPDPAGAVTVPADFIRAELDGRLVRTRDGRNLRVTVLRAAEGGLALLPTPELLAAELVRP